MMRLVAVAVAMVVVTFMVVTRVGSAPLAAQRLDDLSSKPPSNVVDALNRDIQAGTARLIPEDRSGYLRSVLGALRLPVESQMLVFSPSSLQARLINPSNPRAIFFNDSVYVGFVRGGEILEIAVQDREQGMLFYTLDQRAANTPQFKETTICLSCHRTSNSLGVPGLIALNASRTVAGGLFATGSVTNQRSPFEQRWGGWYVTGGSGGVQHNGNGVVRFGDSVGRELSSVEGLFDTGGYPSTQSDIAALLVFLHQTHMANLIARVAWEAEDAGMRGQALLVSPQERLRIGAKLRDSVSEMVDYMLFVDEVQLPEGVRSLSGFVDKFSAEGPLDSKGRSLHQLDLTHRLLRYPCSYLIYSPVFDALPSAALDAVYTHMWRVLSGQERDPRYAAVLTREDRVAIVEILRETKGGLPAYFTPGGGLLRCVSWRRRRGEQFPLLCQ